MSPRKRKSPSEARQDRQQVYNIAREGGKTMMQAADEAGVGAMDTARRYEVQFNANSKAVISRKQLLIQLSKILQSSATPIASRIACATLISKIQGYSVLPSAPVDDEPEGDLDALIEELQPDEPPKPPVLPDVPIVVNDDDKEH